MAVPISAPSPDNRTITAETPGTGYHQTHRRRVVGRASRRRILGPGPPRLRHQGLSLGPEEIRRPVARPRRVEEGDAWTARETHRRRGAAPGGGGPALPVHVAAGNELASGLNQPHGVGVFGHLQARDLETYLHPWSSAVQDVAAVGHEHLAGVVVGVGRGDERRRQRPPRPARVWPTACGGSAPPGAWPAPRSTP